VIPLEVILHNGKFLMHIWQNLIRMKLKSKEEKEKLRKVVTKKSKSLLFTLLLSKDA